MKIKFNLLAASAIIASTVVATPSFAQTSTAWGNGASLPAPYVRAAFDCFGIKKDLITKNTVVADAPIATTINDFNYVSTTNPADDFDCAVDIIAPNSLLSYVSTGSGDGVRGFFTHSPTFASDIDAVTPGVQLGTVHSFSVSETSLGSSDVGIYINGGTIQGQSIKGVNNPGGVWDNPNDLAGPMIQIPLLIAPVAISYDPVYKKIRNADGSITERKLRIAKPVSALDPTTGNSIVVGGLRLDQDVMCKIFNGQITNWNDPALKVLNSNFKLQDPADSGSFSVPLQIVGRSDSSGTTSLFTRHLAAVCGSLVGNLYNDSTSTLPAALRSVAVYNPSNPNTPVAGEALGKFTTAPGNEGVAQYVDFTQDPGPNAGDTLVQGRMGYNGPDFLLPAVLSTQANTYELHAAALAVNIGNGVKFRMPTAANAFNAFAAILPPQSDAAGNYVAGNIANGLRSDPAAWVQGASKLVPLANPAAVATTDLIYPIVGTSNLLTYTCYKSNAQRVPLADFVYNYNQLKLYTDTKTGIIASSGLSPLPKAWRTAIKRTFYNNADGLNLQIGTVGKFGVSPVCAGKVGA